MGRTCGTLGGKEKCIRSCGGETEGKIQIGKSRIWWDENIKTSIKETVWSHMADSGEQGSQTLGSVISWLAEDLSRLQEVCCMQSIV